MIPDVMEKMIVYFGRDARRINHALKVYAFAQIISSREHLDAGKQETLLYTALLHDIGIPEAERKYSSSSGNHQACWALITSRAIPSKSLALIFTRPCGVSIQTQSPSPISRTVAVSG